MSFHNRLDRSTHRPPTSSINDSASPSVFKALRGTFGKRTHLCQVPSTSRDIRGKTATNIQELGFSREQQAALHEEALHEQALPRGQKEH